MATALAVSPNGLYLACGYAYYILTIMYKSRCILVLYYRVPRFAWLENVIHIFKKIIIRLSNKANNVKRYVFFSFWNTHR